MSLQQAIEKKLEQALQPTEMKVINESHKHQGHAGDDGSGESHWRIYLSSHAFLGMSRIAQHQMVNKILSHELKTKIHALSLHLKLPLL